MSDMGLSIVASAIQADQAEMATVADNLANATTPGYAVERVDLSTLPTTGAEGAGGGVALLGVDQLHSTLLDAAARSAQATQAAATTTQQALATVQAWFPEPSGNGLGSQLSTLWSDLSAVANTPGNTAAQGVVINDANTVATTLNDTYNGLGSTSAGLVTQLGTGSGAGVLAQANGYLADVATLNGQIVAGQAAGTDVNSLVDQRSNDLTQLSQLIGATARPEAGGTVTVLALGVALVQDGTAVTLSAAGGPPDPPPSAGAPPATTLQVQTASGTAVAVGGQAGALLQAVNQTIPSQQAQLSAVADALAGGLNGLQASGVDTAGTPGSSLPAVFVTRGSSGYQPGTASAGAIAVDPALTAGQLATASASATTPGTPTLDGSNAAAMAALASAPAGPDALYRNLVGRVGAAAATANQAATSAQTLSDQANAAASSVSGVDTNTQTITLVQAQQAFQAAAKVTSTISDSLQSLLAAV